ncbi:hypothetical protein ABK040_002788 [Willaertia magna]
MALFAKLDVRDRAQISITIFTIASILTSLCSFCFLVFGGVALNHTRQPRVIYNLGVAQVIFGVGTLLFTCCMFTGLIGSIFIYFRNRHVLSKEPFNATINLNTPSSQPTIDNERLPQML